MTTELVEVWLEPARAGESRGFTEAMTMATRH
jgi:hypothetical protein